ncbi:hypothetical protein B0H14DRAFT_2665382, partial [Mycena olivaceomarginata]
LQAPPQNAIFSGYSMSSGYFQKLASALHSDFTAWVKDNPQPFIGYVGEYDWWRRALPEDDFAKAPLLKVFHSPTRKNSEDVADTRLFFSTRRVPADDDSSKENYPAMVQETDIDRKRRDELVALIQQRTGFSVDKNLLRFESVQDVHPFHDPLNGF